MDGAIRIALLKMSKTITTQAQPSTTQAEVMMAQVNQGGSILGKLRSFYHALSLRDFTRMNPPSF